MWEDMKVGMNMLKIMDVVLKDNKILLKVYIIIRLKIVS